MPKEFLEEEREELDFDTLMERALSL